MQSWQKKLVRKCSIRKTKISSVDIPDSEDTTSVASETTQIITPATIPVDSSYVHTLTPTLKQPRIQSTSHYSEDSRSVGSMSAASSSTRYSRQEKLIILLYNIKLKFSPLNIY